MSGLSKWLLAVHSFVHASSVDLLRDTGKYKKTLINCGFLYFRGCYGWHKANRRGGGNGRSRFRQRFCRRQKQKNTLEGVSGCWQKRKKRGFSLLVVISRKSINWFSLLFFWCNLQVQWLHEVCHESHARQDRACVLAVTVRPARSWWSAPATGCDCR